jgi:hypothetical protein
MKLDTDDLLISAYIPQASAMIMRHWWHCCTSSAVCIQKCRPRKEMKCGKWKEIDIYGRRQMEWLYKGREGGKRIEISCCEIHQEYTRWRLVPAPANRWLYWDMESAQQWWPLSGFPSDFETENAALCILKCWSCTVYFVVKLNNF